MTSAASERSLIAHLGLVALVALPLASLSLPALHVDLPQVMASSEVELVAVAEADLPAIAPVEESATPVAASSPWEAPSTIDLIALVTSASCAVLASRDRDRDRGWARGAYLARRRRLDKGAKCR